MSVCHSFSSGSSNTRDTVQYAQASVQTRAVNLCDSNASTCARSGAAAAATRPVVEAMSSGSSGLMRRASFEHSRMYKVTNPQGICLIININKYDASTKHPERLGSENDVARIEKLFDEKLKFDVRIHRDLSGHEILSLIYDIKKDVKESHGCFICFIMAHGNKGCIFGRDGSAEKVNDLVALLQASRCPKLKMKPKIFFIQACRGDAWDIDRSVVHHDGPETLPLEQYCPNESDFLLCFPTSEGSRAYRDPHKGSAFVQTLCDVIEENYETEHLEDMMLEVNRRVTSTPTRGDNGDYYCVPERHSRLLKKCYLNPQLAMSLPITRRANEL